MIVTVANFKGGVGKTTTAVILAEMSANDGKKTLLVDMDRQKNAFSKVMDMDTEPPTPIFSGLRATIAPERTLSLKEHFSDFDTVIIDTPPRPDPALIRSVLSETNVVVCPFMLGEDELGGIADLFAVLPDSKFYVYPLRLSSPFESVFDRSLIADSAEFFSEYGLTEILTWPIRRRIKANIGQRKPFHFQLRAKDKAAYRAVYREIMS